MCNQNSSNKQGTNFQQAEPRIRNHLILHSEDHINNLKYQHNCNNDNFQCDIKCKHLISTIALPRSLGLGRKWRGPVRYPVTPIKHSTNHYETSSFFNNASDDEQIFI